MLNKPILSPLTTLRFILLETLKRSDLGNNSGLRPILRIKAFQQCFDIINGLISKAGRLRWTTRLMTYDLNKALLLLVPCTLKKIKNYNYFIGIDVSRNELDYAVFEGDALVFHKERINRKDDISLFIKELKQLPKFTISKAVFVMEYTGIYCNPLISVLTKLKANFAQVNSLHIQKSSGMLRGKTDKIDSVRIARYATRFADELNLWVAKRPELEQLSNLYSLQNRLKVIHGALRKPLTEQMSFVKKGIYDQSYSSCKETISAIENDLVGVGKQITHLVKSDQKLNRLNEIITSVPNVGPVTSLQIILSTNEFIKINDAKKFACYAGVVPFKQESGIYIGKAKVSPFANKRVKTLLHLCAVASVRKDGEFRQFYTRKTEIEGKHKMSVLNAIRNKLVLRIFSCVKEDRLYEQNYSRTIEE